MYYYYLVYCNSDKHDGSVMLNIVDYTGRRWIEIRDPDCQFFDGNAELTERQFRAI
jgi:hypothetical protein